MNGTKVYYAYTTCIDDETKYLDLYSKLPVERKEKVDGLGSVEDKKLSVLSFTLLKYALSQEGITEFDIYRNEHGKPFLVGDKLFFNLTHSSKLCLVAISNGQVGCDVEKVRKINLKIAKRYFSITENAYLDGIDQRDKEQAFFRLWTKKESYVKAIGRGFKTPFNTFSVVDENGEEILQTFGGKKIFLKEYKIDPEYKASVYSQNQNFEKAKEIVF